MNARAHVWRRVTGGFETEVRIHPYTLNLTRWIW